MNIEEAIRLIESLKIYYNDEQGKEDLAEGIAEMLIDFDDIEAIETLLTAYEKEKEKNRTIKTYKTNLPDNVELICLCKNDFERNLSEDYISKDKIKAKIEEINKRFEKETNPNILVMLKILKNELQSLLEEKE